MPKKKDYGPVPDKDWEQDTPTRTAAELEAEAPGFHAMMQDHMDKMRKVRDKAAVAKAQAKERGNAQKPDSQEVS